MSKIRGSHIKYEPRTVIKGHVMSYFIVEFTLGCLPTPPKDSLDGWTMFVDGASNSKGLGVSLLLVTPDNSIIEKSIFLRFNATNNEAKYEAVLTRLRMAQALGIKGLEVCCRSLVAVNQVNEEYSTKDDWMTACLHLVKELMSTFSRCNF